MERGSLPCITREKSCLFSPEWKELLQETWQKRKKREKKIRPSWRSEDTESSHSVWANIWQDHWSFEYCGSYQSVYHTIYSAKNMICQSQWLHSPWGGGFASANMHELLPTYLLALPLRAQNPKLKLINTPYLK